MGSAVRVSCWRGGGALAIVLSLLLLAACAGGPAGYGDYGGAPADAGDANAVQVMSNGWHTEIVLRRDQIPPGRIPETQAFPDATHYAFGWGDADYYPARKPGVEQALRAALTPTSAVVHLTGLPTAPRQYYKEAEVLAVAVPKGGMPALIDHLDASFARAGGQTARVAGPGLYADSRFYAATGSFHLFNTCNTWTAKGLMRAGLPVGYTRTIRAEDLMEELRPLAAGLPQRDSPELRPYVIDQP